MNRVSTEEVLNKAYRLAYFLHPDKGVAIQIVAAATLKLNVAMAVQSKRLYYNPVGRFSRGELRRTNGIRNKALFSDLHLLQRLVYVESEPYERQKERAAQVTPPDVHADGHPASDEDLLVYFTKHLVRITTKRNAFYVTLGVSRLLHSYSTLETMEIYNAVIGEPERVKDDYYYRSRKAVLMHELYERFGQLIRTCRQRRGEERFETQQSSSEQRSLVRECLRLFTPWDTQCPVPRDFDPFKSVIASLTSKSGADENRVEVNRIHAVLHPECFKRLVAAFGYGAPDERMELPRFFCREENDEAPPRQRSAPADLNAGELAEINQILAEQSRRRRRSSPNAVVRIIVDGVELGRFNPAGQSSISFSAGEDAELIEVKTTDSSGDLLLATHLLTSFGEDAHDETTVSSIRLEGGQDLSLSIKRRLIEATGRADFLIQFGYRETEPRRVARLWWKRLKLRLRPDQGPRLLWAGAIVSVMIICLASYLAYVRLRSHQTSAPAQTAVVQTTSPSPELLAQVDNKINAPDDATPKASQPPRRPKSDKSTAQAREQDVVDATRSGSVVPNVTLKDVKKVYIEVRGDAASDQLRSDLIDRLNSSGVVAAATNADEADAALKIVVSQTSMSALLVNARGTVLWRRTHRSSSDIVKALLSAIRH